MALADKDIDTQMAADWGKIQEKFAVEEPETPAPPADPAEPAQPDPEPEPAKAEDRGDGRRPDGTFAPKTPEPAKAEAVPPPASDAPVDSTRPLRDINRAPSTWKPAARAEFDKLSPTLKAEIHRREDDWAKGRQELIPDAQLGRSMREVVAPYKALIDAEAGGRPEVAFAELMKTAAILRMGTPEQKRNVVLGVAKQYGVDLSTPTQPAAPSGQPQPQTFQDPRVDQLLQQMNAERQQAAQREQEQLESTVTSWMNGVDAQGQPTHPYLGDVMAEMSALVPQIRQANPSLNHEQVLQRAYDTATWGNPEIRTLLQQVKAPGADNQQRVRDAKRAASVNVPRRASTPSAGKPGTVDETLTETARALGLIT